MVSYKRRRYLIKRAFQLKYTTLILFFIFLTAIISSAVIYYAIFPYLSEKLARVYPQGRLVSVLKDANLKVLMAVIFLIPFATWSGINLSHKVAGPWYRLENILRHIAEGDITYEIKLRKHDELQSLADAINDITNGLRSMGQGEADSIRALDETLQRVRDGLNTQPIDTAELNTLISDLQDISSGLKSLISKYKFTS